MYLTAEKKQEIFTKYGKNAQDTGSAEGQTHERCQEGLGHHAFIGCTRR